jgi:hypothetical protein
VTLPNEKVSTFISSRFVLAHRNIHKDKHVGFSHGYRPNQSAVGTTNGAGPRNVQFLILDGDKTVLHALPGFWHAEDLMHELQLALEIHRLHHDKQRTAAQKLEMFEMLHKCHLRHHGTAAELRGYWQPWDSREERDRAKQEERDTFRRLPDGQLALKSIPEVTHDRMLARPFRKLKDFDIEGFVDYGRSFYNNNKEQGKSFPRAERASSKRSLALAKQRERDARRTRVAAASARRWRCPTR